MAFNVVEHIPDRVALRRVLVSVFDKTGLDALVTGIVEACPRIEIYSTGGTYSRIAETLSGDNRLHSIGEVTGQPEMQGGLVKTLDYSIYLGLLAEPYNEAHEEDLVRAGAKPFDAVIVNLYPFASVVAGGDASVETARGNIDIGGPTMLRAAAKNFIRVAAVCDPHEYGPLVDELRANGGTLGIETRFRLAQAAFDHTATYDEAVARFLATKTAADLPYVRR